jgi:glycosyltransferase involved in cell wall biosynthesis
LRRSDHTVVHVLGRLDVGGAERMLLSLCRASLGRDETHVVVALSGKSGALTHQFAVAGVPEYRCALTPVITFPWRFTTLLRQLRPAVAVSHVSLTSAFILLFAAAARVPRRVAVFHSDGDGRAVTVGRRLYRSVSRAVLGATATDAVGVTASTLEFSGLSRSSRVSRQIIPNAVDLTEFVPSRPGSSRRALGISGEGSLVAHVGRAAPEKNRSALPLILNLLDSRTQLVLAGARTETDLSMDTAGTDPQRIHNLGILDDVRPVLAAADLLLLPSVREGLPLVVLEALASGRPVVASDLPGLRYAAERLPHLHLVHEYTSPEAFADAVRSVLASPTDPHDVRRTLSGSEFDLTVAAERWSALCRPAD